LHLKFWQVLPVRKWAFKAGDNWQALKFVVPVVVPKTSFSLFTKTDIL